MKIVLFGATGMIGTRIAAEAAGRGHHVTGVNRGGTGGAVAGDATRPGSVAELASGHDAIVSATHIDADNALPTAEGLLAGARSSGVRRIVVVGGAGSLEVAPGVQLVDTPDFPEAWRSMASAHRDALALYRAADDLEWTYISPAAMIAPGERTGVFRLGTDQLLTDAEGQSRISAEDYAVALVDELEKGAAIRKRITLAY
jgi:putative NADH-flavin reductase